MDGSDGQESACNAEGQFDPWVGKIPQRREWLPTSVFWPGKSHCSQAGYSIKNAIPAGYSIKNVEGVGHN